jgi:DNA invertase Pin-like site-specific DNA recombinase
VRPRKLTAQLEEDLASEFASGTPVDELAAKYGVSRATTYRIAREHQVKNNARRTFTPAGRGKSLTPAQIGTAQRLNADGMSIRQIAQAIGSSRATVHRTLAAVPHHRRHHRDRDGPRHGHGRSRRGTRSGRWCALSEPDTEHDNNMLSPERENPCSAPRCTEPSADHPAH